MLNYLLNLIDPAVSVTPRGIRPKVPLILRVLGRGV